MSKKVEKNLTKEELLLKKYKSRLIGEAIGKSLMLGLIAGGVLSVIVAVISIITKYDALWLAFTVLGVATVAVAIWAYFMLYRTNIQKIAARVDDVGLEERVITMVEYANREDVLAQRQRADAQRALEQVVPKQVKFKVSKIAIALLLVVAVLSTFTMVTAHLVVSQATTDPEKPPVEEIVTEEDKIIAEMLEELRKIIDDAEVRQELKDTLHKMVDDLEARLYPTDSTEVKIAKISETAQEIHRILQAELSKTTVGQELQKHETTEALGTAIESGDPQTREQGFQAVYDSIEVLVSEGKYDVLYQTADDIEQSLEDCTIKPDQPLEDALRALAEALRVELPPPPPETGGEEDKTDDEIDMEQAMEEIKDAMDAIQDALEQEDNIKETDEAIQDAMQDAMEQLGQETANPNDNPEENPDKEGEDEGEVDEDEIKGPAHPTEDGEIVYDAVIDGETPYMDKYDEYYESVLELLTSGDLTDEEREKIENYFNILK